MSLPPPSSPTGEGPLTPVPPNWAHRDLKRHLVDQSRRATSRSLSSIEQLRGCLESQANSADADISEKRARISSLQAELAALQAGVAQLEEKSTRWRQLFRDVCNQNAYQRSIVEEPEVEKLVRAVGAPPSEAAGDGGAAPLPVLGVYFMHYGDLCLAAPSPERVANPELVRQFLRRYAPLFTWSEEQQCVPPPLLFDEPCLMETSPESRCTNAACAYWHHDEMGHLKAAFARFAGAADGHCTRDGRLCAFSGFFAAVREFVAASTAVDALSRGVGYFVNRVVDLGWHEVLLSASPGARGGDGLAAPVAAREAGAGAGTALAPAAIPSAEERDAWEVAEAALQHGSTPADVFTVDPSALSWRCFARLAAATAADGAWLAEHGRRMFPASPHLQLDAALSTLAATDDSAAGVAACVAAARALSAQAAAAALCQPDSTYCAVAARYVAYLVAATAVTVAGRGDTAEARGLLRMALGEATSSTSNSSSSGDDSGDDDDTSRNRNDEVGENKEGGEGGGGAAPSAGGFFILPIAQQNLLLMLLALERTGGLRGAETLPLGAISDCPLVLGGGFPVAPERACVARLSAQLRLLGRCQQDGLDPALLDRLKATAQLSLLRVFSASIDDVEQLMQKASLSEEGQAGLWLGYAAQLCHVDGFPLSLQVALELLQSGEGRASCLLALLMTWHLQAHGVRAEATEAAGKTAAAFMERHGIEEAALLPPSRSTHAAAEDGNSEREEGEEEEDAALCVPLGVARVEVVACAILLALQAEQPAEQWARLSAIRVERSGGADGDEDDYVPTVLLTMARARAAGAAHSIHAFHEALDNGLCLLAAAHRRWWSPLDRWTEAVVGVGHCLALLMYRSVPLLLGAHCAASTRAWRVAVLEAATRHGVLHPLLQSTDADESTP